MKPIQPRKWLMNRLRTRLWLLGVLTTILTFSTMELFTNSVSLSVPTIWVTSGLERIGLTAQPGRSTSIELYAARGEYEPFQIGIQADQGALTNVNVSMSALQDAAGHTISNGNITLYREHYVYVEHPSPNELISSNRSLGAGWYADGLIPFVAPNTQADLTDAELDAVPFYLEAGTNQPIWVDIFVPRNTPAGTYTGTFTVTSDQGEASGQVSLTVWNFELPLKPSLNSSFQLWDETRKAAMVEVLKHRLMPAANFDPADERELIDQWGLRSQRLPFWSGADVDSGTMNPPPSVEEIRALAAQHQPDLQLYLFPADEIGAYPNLHEPLRQWARNIHQAGVLNMVTIAPIPELYDDGSGTGRSAVDIWVLLPNMFDAASEGIAEVMRRGHQVWSYNALVQDGYSPKWQIDFAPINFRIQPGFISQSLGLTGLLYWRMDQWTEDPWNNVQTYFNQNNYYPGDGMLVYPGQQVGIAGIVPSMRLKWLREGVEDYEYVQILKNLGRGEWALQVARQAGQDWKTWTQNPEVLESVRRQLGEEIHKIMTENQQPFR